MRGRGTIEDEVEVIDLSSLRAPYFVDRMAFLAELSARHDQ